MAERTRIYPSVSSRDAGSGTGAAAALHGQYQALATSEPSSHGARPAFASFSIETASGSGLTASGGSLHASNGASQSAHCKSEADVEGADAAAAETSASSHQFHGKKLGLASLVVLSFYTVCGGPFGIEDIVRAGGPRYAILGFALIFVWAVPEAMITAELSIAMPEASGSVAWVEHAFGEYWGFQKGWLSWLSGIADNALYPILFLDCLMQFLFHTQDAHENSTNSLDEATLEQFRWILVLLITVGLTYINYCGLEVVGRVAIGICLFSLSPFIVFCVMGFPLIRWERLWEVNTDMSGMDDDHYAVTAASISETGITQLMSLASNYSNITDGSGSGVTGSTSTLTVATAASVAVVNWRLLLNTFFWNINFWESSSSFSADIENPERNYPLGMTIAVILVFLSLLLPVIVGVGASDEPWSDWKDGFFIHLADKIVGKWLAYWMILAAMITNIGMFEAEMSSDAWQVAGMADKGILPAVLSTRNAHGAPTYGIILSAMGVVCLGWMDFTEVIDMLNLLYCYGQLIEFAAYLKLRYCPPQDQSKTIRFYLSTFSMTLLMILPIFFIFVVLWLSSDLALSVSLVLALSGVGAYHLLRYAKTHKWCHFHGS